MSEENPGATATTPPEDASGETSTSPHARRLVIRPLVFKAGAIELHCLVGVDVAVGEREDNGVSVGRIAGVVRARRNGAGVNDGFIVVHETSVPGAERSSAIAGVGAVRRIGRIGRKIIRHSRSLSGAKV
jgi:hypothetical protein